MHKFEEAYLRRGPKDDVSPVKSPSPDFMASNKIAVTKSPKNLGRNRSSSGIVKTFTPLTNKSHKLPNTKMGSKAAHANEEQRQTVQSTEHKYYFSANRVNQSDSNFNNTMKLETLLHPHSYCRLKNEEMIRELRQLIHVITQQRVPQGQQRLVQPQSESILRQVTILDHENERLFQLVKELQGRICHSHAPKYCERCRRHSVDWEELEKEREMLQQRLEQTAFECNQERESILISNQTLMSQAESLKDRNQILEKEVESLRHLVREREGKEQETRRKGQLSEKSGKLSLSLIQEQYQESLKTMKTHFADEISSRGRGYERQMMEQSVMIGELEGRLRALDQKLTSIYAGRGNSRVWGTLDKQLQVSKSDGQKNHELHQSQQRLSRLETTMKDRAFQTDRETQQKINKLIQNYESTIHILKSDLENSRKTCSQLQSRMQTVQLTERQEELPRFREQLAVVEDQQGQQEILHQNQELRKEVQTMQSTINALQTSQRALKSQMEEIKLTAITPNAYNLLEQCNAELREQLRQQPDSRRLEELQHENRCLAKESEELKSVIDKIEKESQILCNELSSFRCLEKQLTMSSQENTRLRLENENLRASSKDFEQKEQEIHKLQGTVRNYARALELNQHRIKELESLNQHFRSQLQTNCISVEEHQKKVDALREEHAKEHSQWQQEVSRSNDRLSAAHAKIQMLSELPSPNYEFLTQELLEIRKLLDENKIEEFQAEFANLSEMYSRELIHLQQKNHQIKTLTDDLWMQNTRNSELEKAKLALEQKVNTLESNVTIADAQLQERKQLCDKLLADNQHLQREVVVLKKGRLEKQILEPTKAKARVISERIDSLLAMEEQRRTAVDTNLSCAKDNPMSHQRSYR